MNIVPANAPQNKVRDFATALLTYGGVQVSKAAVDRVASAIRSGKSAPAPARPLVIQSSGGGGGGNRARRRGNGRGRVPRPLTSSDTVCRLSGLSSVVNNALSECQDGWYIANHSTAASGIGTLLGHFSSLCDIYRLFKFKSLKLTFVPILGYTSTGAVVIAYDPYPAASISTTSMEALSHFEKHTAGSVKEQQVLSLQGRDFVADSVGGETLWSEATLTSSMSRSTCMGAIRLHSDNGEANAAPIGYLQCEAVVHFRGFK